MPTGLETFVCVASTIIEPNAQRRECTWSRTVGPTKYHVWQELVGVTVGDEVLSSEQITTPNTHTVVVNLGTINAVDNRLWIEAIHSRLQCAS